MGQVVNAIVAGVVPGFRVILLSDGLLKRFPQHEVEAILRHEAGHLKLWHLPTRLLSTALPLLALSIVEFRHLQGMSAIDFWFQPLGMTLLALGAGYLWFATRWLSHQMEFEADLYSIYVQDSALPDGNSRFVERAEDMADALLRLAAISPNQYERGIVFTSEHPSAVGIDSPFTNDS